MMGGGPPADKRHLLLPAGLAYAVIIVAGIWSEGFVRAALIEPGDAAATAAAIAANETLFRASVAADMVMALCDVALAVLLYMILKSHGALLALLAMVLRLVQASIIGANLVNQQAALLALGGAGGSEAVALLHLQMQSHGYDLGLVFFGAANIAIAVLILRSGWVPRPLGWLVAAAGLVYLAGSFLRILAPHLSGTFVYAYAVPVVAETSFALWLLAAGFRPRLAAH
ncbi:hypothetical protein DEA8626_01321 [Defluviimonas aquaemixtae]|uniref:DUF4386 domain-containing protein n=2 Tax=Albidovulum aquaemixtae TaxID=1542388 RepID=A0A2R8B5A2_9RHOB|nr:hypothetical protein DEA8626_01321 [Defluviimonas aquaemixtae]